MGVMVGICPRALGLVKPLPQQRTLLALQHHTPDLPVDAMISLNDLPDYRILASPLIHLMIRPSAQVAGILQWAAL
jgi:hypothetical protein